MWPYIIFALIIILLYHYRQPEWMVVVLVLFAALRYGTGWDFFSYYSMGESLTDLKYADLEYGPIWSALFNLAYNLHAPQLIIAIPAILNYPILFWALSLISNKNVVSEGLFVYTFWPFFYLGSFSTIRQSLAVSIGFLFIAFLFRKKIPKALIALVLAVLIHPSAIVLAIFPIVTKMKRALNLRECLILVIGGGLVLSFALKAVSSVLGYGKYIEDAGDFGGSLSIVYFVVAAHLALAVSRVKNPYSIRSKIMSVVLIAFALEALVFISNLPTVITRIVLYFEVLLIRVVHYSLGVYRQSKTMRIAFDCVLVFFFFLYLFWIRNDKNASAGYVPYQWIISIF